MSKQNPQLEDGHFKIANDLWEFIIKSNISKDEFKVVGAIIRQTYGWNKKEAPISFSLFEKLTNIHRRNIQRAIILLLEKGLILRQQGTKLKFGKPVYNYQLVKKNWFKDNAGCSQCDYSAVVNATTVAVVNATTIKYTKDNLNINTNVLTADDIEKKELNKQITEIFTLFREINPMIHYGHTTNRKAIEEMIKKFGFEKLKATVEYSNSIQGKKYAPTITTPYLLKIKLGELMSYAKRQNNSGTIIV
jgi:phage replication O-like protein O